MTSGAQSVVSALVDVYVGAATETAIVQTIDKLNAYEIPRSFEHPFSPFTNHVIAKIHIIKGISFINAYCNAEDIKPVDLDALTVGLDTKNYHDRLVEAYSQFVQKRELVLKLYKLQLEELSQMKLQAKQEEDKLKAKAETEKNSTFGDNEFTEELTDLGLRAVAGKRSKLLDDAEAIAQQVVDKQLSLSKDEEILDGVDPPSTRET